jgi:hypothetical protein
MSNKSSAKQGESLPPPRPKKDAMCKLISEETSRGRLPKPEKQKRE